MDTHLIALNPTGMAQAQTGLIEFCENKLRELQTELSSA